jgi:hypothetical protein
MHGNPLQVAAELTTTTLFTSNTLWILCWHEGSHAASLSNSIFTAKDKQNLTYLLQHHARYTYKKLELQSKQSISLFNFGILKTHWIYVQITSHQHAQSLHTICFEFLHTLLQTTHPNFTIFEYIMRYKIHFFFSEKADLYQYSPPMVSPPYRGGGVWEPLRLWELCRR